MKFIVIKRFDITLDTYIKNKNRPYFDHVELYDLLNGILNALYFLYKKNICYNDL